MNDLRIRFGRLVAAHRKRAGFTQEALASLADLSSDMITRIEAGQTGTSFASIQRLAEALGIDPAELFTSELSTGSVHSPMLAEITARLAALNERELIWASNLLDAALRPRG